MAAGLAVAASKGAELGEEGGSRAGGPREDTVYMALASWLLCPSCTEKYTGVDRLGALLLALLLL